MEAPSTPPNATAREVRLALGWTTEDVERRATAAVHFRDRPRSAVVLERDPVSFVYDDPQHGFTLPPGRYVRIDQSAGRVHTAAVTPVLEALPAAAARAVLDTLAGRLTNAGWRRASDEGMGVDAALAAAAAATSGLTPVATWRLPRPSAPWAEPPSGARPVTGFWNGPEARVSLNTLPDQPPDGRPRFVVEVQITDVPLRVALGERADGRRVAPAAPESGGPGQP